MPPFVKRGVGWGGGFELCDIMLIGDLNLNTKSKNNSNYSDLCETFELTNIIKANTCFKSSNQTSIDIILTGKQVFKNLE